MQNDLSHKFFARSPSIYTILPPLKVVKLCKLRENVQKTCVTSHFALELLNIWIKYKALGLVFHELALADQASLLGLMRWPKASAIL